MDVYADLVRLGTAKSAFEDNVGAGGGDWTRIGLAADFVNGTIAFNDVTGFTFDIPINTNWTMEAELLIQTIATTNLPRLGISASGLWGGEIEYQSAAAAKIFAEAWGFNALVQNSLTMAAGTAPIANNFYLARAFAKGRSRSDGVALCKLQLAAETAGTNAARLLVGSEFRYRFGPA